MLTALLVLSSVLALAVIVEALWIRRLTATQMELRNQVHLLEVSKNLDFAMYLKDKNVQISDPQNDFCLHHT